MAPRVRRDAPSALRLQKIGSVASFVLPIALVVSGLVYLMGNLREALGLLSYSTADLLAGPVFGASFVVTILALRERIGTKASGRMDLAVLAAVLGAAFMVAVAFIRDANRGYHISHPELQLESSISVMVGWTTLVEGLLSTGWHFIGWAFLLTGSAAWTSERLPRLLSGLILIISIWQGILLWRANPERRKRK
jgi:hypothetical protein